MTKPPTIAELHHELLGIELCCRSNTCRHSKTLPVDDFGPDETVVTIARRARCTRCGSKTANVHPRWKQAEGAGRPL